ncbi:MAG: hypothetical protein HY661_19325 [Betaproteobacteria bacterium]|nr:hypothetical protein [Betaproteobacteria bacterium]
MFRPYSKRLVLKAIKLALAGDGAVLRACLDKLVPSLKTRDAPIQLVDFAGTIAQKGDRVLQAVAGGEITPDEAHAVMAALGTHARITETDALEKRVKALEEARSAQEAQRGKP